MAYKDLDKKREANARAKAKLLAKNPDYFANWMRRDRENQSEKYKERERNRTDRASRYQKYANRHPEKLEARRLARAALKRGDLVKPQGCQWCGLDKPLEMDHHDYTQPLKVSFLCRECHISMDRYRRLNLLA